MTGSGKGVRWFCVCGREGNGPGRCSASEHTYEDELIEDREFLPYYPAQSDSHGLREALEREIEWLRNGVVVAEHRAGSTKNAGAIAHAAARADAYRIAADRLTEILSSHPVQSESDVRPGLSDEEILNGPLIYGSEALKARDAEARLERVREWAEENDSITGEKGDSAREVLDLLSEESK